MTAPESPHAAAAELPIHLTRFVGRDQELEELTRLVCTTRLLTLTGAGGSGKTRLGREAALRAAPSFARVAWVDLAPLADAQLLAQQVAAALHIPDRADVPILDLLIGVLGAEPVLIVLDNCEHLVTACAELAEVLLRACPRLTVLATSREALGVASEMAWLVPPLASGEAVQLFVERARGALPSFALTTTNADAVSEICRRLDGIPLAIELAAARVRVLSPEQIAQRLGDAFRLLSSNSRTALPRHRTLRATMDWSLALLGTRQRVLLRRLAVFAGRFTLDAAEAVCIGEPLGAEDILDGISALVDRSLVIMEPDDGVARYRLLETVRQCGIEEMTRAGELQMLEQQHAEHFLAMVEAAAPNLVGGSVVPGLVARLAADHDNIRAAIAWSAADPSRADLALRFVGSLFWFWYAVGQFREARQFVDRALALDAPASPLTPLTRGRALLTSAITALAQGDYTRSCADFEAALPLLRAGGDEASTGTALAKYGAARLLGGDVEGAVAVLDEAIEFMRAAPPPDRAATFARFWRGWAAYFQGDFDLAHELATRNATIARAHAISVTLAHCLVTLARIELARGNVQEACSLVAEGLELEVVIGDGWGIALGLEVATMLAARRGRCDDATRLLAGTEAHRERIAVAIRGIAPTEREQLIAQLRTTLGPRFDELYGEGRTLSTTEAVRLALAEATRDTAEHRIVLLDEARPQSGGRPRLRVHALGPLQVLVGDQLVDQTAWGSARPRELLVYLLMHPEGRTKEQTGLAFWPDASPAQLRNSFHVTLHRLRRALGSADWVTLAGERYQVNPELVEEFDVLEFERDVIAARRAVKRQDHDATARLEQALTRFRGDFLDGEPASDWHLEHRDRLQRLYVDALMELGARAMAEERHAEAAEVFRRVLARDELHEEAIRALMRCHAVLGERAQALRLYQRFAGRLREELDADPSAETSRLFERLQQGAGV